MAQKQDINDFNARIKRINDPRNNAYYDQDMGMHVPKRVSRDKIKKNAKKQQDSAFSAFLVSMIVGGFGLMIAQAVRYRYFEVSGAGNTALFIDVLVAVWIVALLSAMMRRRTFSARFAQVTGIAAMVVGGHNLIWRWPNEMGILYTMAYVEEVKARTAPISLVVGDRVFVMPDQEQFRAAQN